MAKYKILIVEDQSLTRQLYKMVLSKSDEYEIIGSIADAQYAEMYCRKYQVDAIIMDVVTKNGSSGLDASERIKRLFPNVKIMMSTSMPEVSFIERARNIGIESFYYKNYSDMDVAECLKATLEGEKIYPEESPVVKIGLADSSEFSAREIEVLRLLMEGETDRQIADKLNLSIETVHTRVKNILSKTGYTTRTKLAVAVRESGFIINS